MIVGNFSSRNWQKGEGGKNPPNTNSIIEYEIPRNGPSFGPSGRFIGRFERQLWHSFLPWGLVKSAKSCFVQVSTLLSLDRSVFVGTHRSHKISLFTLFSYSFWRGSSRTCNQHQNRTFVWEAHHREASTSRSEMSGDRCRNDGRWSYDHAKYVNVHRQIDFRIPW